MQTIEREKPVKKISEKEHIKISAELLETEYKDYISNPDVYRESDFRYTQYNFIYKFLVSYNYIKPIKDYTQKELKSYIIHFFNKVNKLNVPIKTYLRDNWNN